MAVGELKVVASDDLHGLGATDGPPVVCSWTPPSLLPRLLPWLAVLGLLILKPNRTARAWWIWLPLLCLAGIEAAVRPQLEFIPSEVLDVFCEAFNSVGFGVAAVWLLAAHLRHRLRFLAFLKMLVAAAAMSALAYLVRLDWEEPGMALGFLILVGVCVLVAVAALSLAGWLCRRQYRPAGLTLWLVLFIAALWVLLSAPFFVFAVVASDGGQWLEFLQAILAFVALTFVMLLPFLVLAFANGLYRERLKELLHLGLATPPPVLAPPPPGAGPAI